VLEKNPNVVADLSGLLVGKCHMPQFLNYQQGYVEQLKLWLKYIDNFDKILFGTDWPLANYQDYIEFTKAIIPEEHWEKVFYLNSKRIFGL
ncbi:MAG: amidohydrolase, partial [Symbiobacteriaceae bacterium]|nr:amidohydrolase [Symbiobacteriaceae bacterium]